MTGERGSVTAFVAVLATALIMVAGMVVDGGGALSAGMDARRLAASAARAGAQAVDVSALRAGRGTVLDRTAAARAASEFLSSAGATGDVTVNGDLVSVTVSVSAPRRLLPLPARAVTATRSARAVAGVRHGGDVP